MLRGRRSLFVLVFSSCLLFFTLVRGEENGIDCNQGDKPSDRGKRARGRGKRMSRKETLVIGRRRQAVHMLSSLRAVYCERTVGLESFDSFTDAYK